MKKESVIRVPPDGTPPVPVFDFGGVLFDWNPRYLFRRFFDGDGEGMERFLAETDFDHWNAALDRGQSFADAVRAQGLRFPQYAEPIRAFDSRWEETVRGPMPGMENLLRRMHNAGIPLYGLSNTSAEKFYILRRSYPLLGWFSGILLSGEVGITKPDPRIFEKFLERTGLRKESLLFIDDSQANIAAALSIGWNAVQFTSAEELARKLGACKIL
ncbi:MAG: HAD family phosphatase [Anaerolineales bacterium]